MGTFFLDVLASDRKFFRGKVSALVIPCEDGEKEILAHHEDMLIAVTSGEMRAQLEDGQWTRAICGPGFAQVVNNRVTLLVETALLPEEVDIQRAKRAKEEAQEQLRQKQSIQEYNASQAALARALSRLKYGEKKYQ